MFWLRAERQTLINSSWILLHEVMLPVMCGLGGVCLLYCFVVLTGMGFLIYIIVIIILLVTRT